MNSAIRALAVEDGKDYVWFWIGDHREYERIIKRGYPDCRCVQLRAASPPFVADLNVLQNEIMEYRVELKRTAIKDLRSIPRHDPERMIERLEELRHDLAGDVKKLTSHTPEYRLRSGQWRALFEVEGNRVIVYRVLHRRESYR